ncbi:MAG: hypothetical protein LBL15_02475 [Oscillospiraceae bacterium]|jgi:hypothetical protein|nr:hypothetical protein [Oscillospiraceae bacterium]
MLSKLIKHDFRALSRVLLPTQLAILAAAILATAGFAVNLRGSSSGLPGEGFAGLIRMIASVLSAVMLIAVIAASILIAFIIFQRFYKNLMSDEGYLTFTLPVTTAELLWSKLITAVLWTAISSVVLIICVNIFILFGTGRGFVNLDAYRALFRFFGEAGRLIGARLLLPVAELLLFALVATLFGILHVYLALIIGGVVAHKRKLLAGIGFYFAINIGVSVLSTAVQAFTANGLVNELVNMLNELTRRGWSERTTLGVYNYVVNAVQPYFWSQLAFQTAVGAGFFLLSRYLLRSKLNLE